MQNFLILIQTNGKIGIDPILNKSFLQYFKIHII